MQKTIFHLKKHCTCKLTLNVMPMKAPLLLWKLQPRIMEHLVITWTPNVQNNPVPPKKKAACLLSKREKVAHKARSIISIAVNLKLELRTRRGVTDVAFIRCVWLTVGDIKTYEVETMQSTTKMEYGMFCFCAAAHFKDSSWNWGGQLSIWSFSKSGTDNCTLQNALLCSLTLKLCTPQP